VSKASDELLVMGRLARQLEVLEPDVRARVLSWLAARFNAPALAPRDGCRAVPLAPVREENHSGKAQGE
jgi:hypothetical protein